VAADVSGRITSYDLVRKRSAPRLERGEAFSAAAAVIGLAVSAERTHVYVAYAEGVVAKYAVNGTVDWRVNFRDYWIPPSPWAKGAAPLRLLTFQSRSHFPRAACRLCAPCPSTSCVTCFESSSPLCTPSLVSSCYLRITPATLLGTSRPSTAGHIRELPMDPAALATDGALKDLSRHLFSVTPPPSETKANSLPFLYTVFKTAPALHAVGGHFAATAP
jgi:hypothetical protein